MAKTFAERARALEKKYKRAKYDPFEKEELTNELRKLRDEQEEYRINTGIADEENEVEQYPLGGFTSNPFLFQNITGASPSITAVPSMMVNAPSVSPIAGYSNIMSPTNSGSPTYETPKSSILPTAISTAFSLAGNIAGMRNAKELAKKNQISLPRTTAEQISLEPQRESLRREAGTATNVALKNARDVSSPGQAYANQIAGVSSIYDSLGTGLAQSYMNEANTNAQMRQQTNLANMEAGARERMYNAEIRDRYLNQAAGYRDAAFQAIPEGLRDYRAQRSQDMWMANMGKDYGLYNKINPNATFREKLMNSLFGSPYGVYNRDYINSING